MYRVQVFGPQVAAAHWHVHHDGARIYRRWAARGEKMPMAIALGGEPVLPYAATSPLPPGISELLFAGFLNGKGIETVPAKTIPLEVPANAEMVIEVSIYKLSVRDPGMAHFYRGRMAASMPGRERPPRPSSR